MPTYKNETRGTWYCKFYYKDWTGERKQKKKEGFRTQREAKEYEREFLKKSRADCSMLFSSLVELYLEDCKSRLKPTTYENKKHIIQTKILPYFKDMPLNAIESTTIRKWQNELITHKDKNGKPFTPAYLRLIHVHITAIFNFAKKYYRLSENPAAICGSMGKSKADTIQFWTLEEFKQFLAAGQDKPLSKVMFSLLFWSGMRSGELLALTLNDFDFDKKTVQINKNFAKLNGKELILDPKTPKSNRTITLPLFLCDMIQEYANNLYDYQPQERLFDVKKCFLYHELEKGCQKSGVKKIRVHDLRHSHASLLIEQGFDPLVISERLGHENIQTTLQVYSHLYPNKHTMVADKLQELNN